MTQTELRHRALRALRGDPGQAEDLIARMEAEAQAAGDPRQRAVARFFRAQLDQVRGNHSAAARGYVRTAAEFARLKMPRERVASEVGSIQVHALLGKREAVLRSLRRLRRRRTDSLARAGAEIAIGSALDSLGDERGAERCFRRAITSLGRRRKPPVIQLLRATARQNLGLRLARRGAVGAALREIEAALAYFTAEKMSGNIEIARHNRGWVRALASDVEGALRDLRAAAAAFRERGDRRRAALARMDEAELLFRLGDYTAAAEKGGAAARNLAGLQVPLEAAHARLLAARAEIERGRRSAARRGARAACKAFQAAGDRAGEALASVLLEEGLDKAEEELCKCGHLIGALDALLAHAATLSPAAGAALLTRRAPAYPAALKRWIRPHLLMLRAQAATKMRIPLLRRAFRAAEQHRLRAPTAGLRATALAAHLSIYEQFAAALLERDRRHDRKEAFLVLDAVRARTLREELERSAPGLFDQPRVRKAREKLAALWAVIEHRETHGGGDLRSAELPLLREVTACERALVEALDGAESQVRGATTKGMKPPGPCLAYSVIEGEVQGLLWTPEGVESWQCGPVGLLRHGVDRFRFQVTRRLFGAHDLGAAQAALDELSSRLLPPRLELERLAVVLPPELGDLPIEALSLHGSPLIERMELVHVPCACVEPVKWRRDGKRLLVGIESPLLPAISREIRQVRRILRKVAVLQGVAATREAILAELAGKSIIHIAGHARAREDLALLSALRAWDGWITAADLRDHALHGALVVLSACRTGDPSLRWYGESMGGFPRALLAAGAASIIASRWEVSDETAHLWMRHFYKALAGRDPAAALARAARQMRRSRPHPADWTAFLAISGGRLCRG